MSVNKHVTQAAARDYLTTLLGEVDWSAADVTQNVVDVLLGATIDGKDGIKLIGYGSNRLRLEFLMSDDEPETDD